MSLQQMIVTTVDLIIKVDEQRRISSSFKKLNKTFLNYCDF